MHFIPFQYIRNTKSLVKDKPLQFNTVPNGYKDAMQVFNKILKPPIGLLREQGLSSVVYVDETLLRRDTFLECKHNVTNPEPA